MYETIKILANKNDQSITDTVSRLLGHGISYELLTDNTGNITATVGKMFREISRTDTDRLAKLIIRTMKAAAAGMYLAAQAAGGTEAPKRLDGALGMAVRYIKLPDAEMTSMSEAAGAGGTKPAPEWESCGISDDELFEL
jgi:hypothetical protein